MPNSALHTSSMWKYSDMLVLPSAPSSATHTKSAQSGGSPISMYFWLSRPSGPPAARAPSPASSGTCTWNTTALSSSILSITDRPCALCIHPMTMAGVHLVHSWSRRCDVARIMAPSCLALGFSSALMAASTLARPALTSCAHSGQSGSGMTSSSACTFLALPAAPCAPPLPPAPSSPSSRRRLPPAPPASYPSSEGAGERCCCCCCAAGACAAPLPP
mmetsp:Transcript_24022/g.61166  ORF Transcript_24022/g.61166 Transcript_24022/m.61166 type:complete len:218 (+) Transcript_24022:376-1029(+)